MDPQLRERVIELLGQALERPSEERAGWLAATCPDLDMRREVESLLGQDSRAFSGLERPPLPLLGLSGTLEPGSRVGPYRVAAELGRGGMGVVYLAERADEEYERRVALKVLKQGLDTAEVVRRFRTERQILANLKHPGIAELYEGGTTEEGRPYFAMEHVEGERIDRYCDARGLGLRDRLELVRRVCAAVQFAHQNLVVHRDLKPANILVTESGQPKLLDFGIAKLLDPASREPLTSTEGVHHPMTPEYASPEQVKAEPVTTATDVYALGLILYELLTGRRPHRGAAASSPEDLRRAICEEEPPKPSSAVAGERREESKRLARRLAGDLDTIVLKALEKDPRRRYGSVEQLSADLRRHLEGLPVDARKPTFFYRAAKFLRRNGKQVTAAAAATSLVAGFLVDREFHQRETARALARAERVTELLVELFQVSDPNETRGETITAREVLDRGAERIRDELTDEPEVQAALTHTMGWVYRGLGLRDRAEALLRESLALRRRIFGDVHADVAVSLNALGLLLNDKGEFEQAEELLREALATREQLLGKEHLDVALTMNNLGLVLQGRGDFEEAESYYRRALALQRELLGDEHPYVATGLNNLAVWLYVQGDFERAEPLFRETLVLKKRAQGERHPETILARNNLAVLLYAKGDYEAAERMYETVLGLRREVLGDEHPDVAESLNSLGMLRYMEGDYEAAERLLEEAHALRRRALHDGHPGLGESLHNLGLALFAKGEHERAEAAFRDAVARRERALGAAHPDVAASTLGLAMLDLARGDAERAGDVVRRALAVYRDALTPGHWRIAHAESLLGASLTALGRYAEAEPLLVEGYRVLRKKTSPASQYTRDALARLVALYEAWGKPDKSAEYRALAGPDALFEP